MIEADNAVHLRSGQIKFFSDNGYGLFRNKSDLVLNGMKYGRKRAGLVFQTGDDWADTVVHKGLIVSNAGKKPQEAQNAHYSLSIFLVLPSLCLHVGKRLETCTDSR